jgi:type II secretory pathway component PulF
MPDHFPTFRRLFREPLPLPLWSPQRARLTQRLALLRLIAVAAEERLPLTPLLEAWSVDERGVQGTRVRRLDALLKDGVPLADAVEQAPRVLGDEDILAIRFGAQSGALAAAVRQRLGDARAQSSYGRSLFRRTMIYVVIVGFVAAAITTFLCIKIIPSMQAILADFSMTAPPPLQWSIELARTFANYWWAGAVVVLILLALMFSVDKGRFIRHAIIGRAVRPLRELRALEVLRLLGVAAQAGRPIAGAVSTLARYHFDPAIRSKLLYVRNEMEQGADVWQSMSAGGLIAPREAAFLNTAERVGNRPWALEMLSTSKRRRTLRRLERLSELLLPAVVLVFGAFVLLQALALFTPLVTILFSVL